MTSTPLRRPSALSRHPLQKTTPPSSDKTSRPPIPFALKREDGPTHKPRLQAGRPDPTAAATLASLGVCWHGFILALASQ
jgi:hypothetical protein